MPFLLFPTAASAVQMCIVVLQTLAACLKDKGKASEVNWADCGDWVSRNSPIMENMHHVLRFPLFLDEPTSADTCGNTHAQSLCSLVIILLAQMGGSSEQFAKCNYHLCVVLLIRGVAYSC